jgi:demethylmenaquinone methyltransferase/2-methoxy-6-polyprenyl-1,4-benzoquinol methylase
MNILDTEKDEKRNVVESMFNSIAKRYDFLNRFLSFGTDRHWRKKAVKIIAQHSKNPHILDVATGTADLAIAAAKTIDAKIVGIDISKKMLEIGKEKIVKKRLSESINFIKAEAENIPFPDVHFDVAMCAFGVRNFSDPHSGLAEMHRVLRNAGMIVVLEFSKPQGFIFKRLYNFYFRQALPLIGRLFSGNKKAYSYLPDSVSKFPDNEDFLKMLSAAGFSDTCQIKLTGGIASIYTGLKFQRDK